MWHRHMAGSNPPSRTGFRGICDRKHLVVDLLGSYSPKIDHDI
jgi:hypothetical protein